MFTTRVFSVDRDNPLSARKLIIAGLIKFSMMNLLLAVTIKSSAYLTTSMCKEIIIRDPLNRLERSNLLVVIFLTDLNTAFSKPFRVKLASVGLIIPP